MQPDLWLRAIAGNVAGPRPRSTNAARRRPAMLLEGRDVANGIVEEKRVAPATSVFESAEPRVRRTDPGGARLAAIVAADVVAFALAALLATAAALWHPDLPMVSRVGHVFPIGEGIGLAGLVALSAWTMFVFYAVGLYRKPRRSISWSTLEEAVRGLTALTSACWAALLIGVAATGSTGAAGELVVFWAAAAVSVPIARSFSRRWLWPGAALTERVLVVGAGDVGHLVAAKIRRRTDLHMTVVGFLDDGEPRPNGDGPYPPVLGSLKELAAVIRDQGVTRVVVAFSQARHQRFLDVVRTCADADVRVSIVPRLFEVISSRAGIDEIEGIPLLDVANVELSRFNLGVKRVFDLAAGGLLLIVLLPVIGALALAVKLDSPGPVFFRQERMGRGGSVFRIFKMRSMREGAETQRDDLSAHNEYSGPMFKIKEDPRLTRTGRWMRRWSLDELPQIFNVVLGDMSLVGPRPLWVEEAKQCKGWTRKRLDITPGITGLWQVTGRNDIPFDEMVKLDYMYVTGWSLSWDIKLLLRTIPAVLDKRGAY